ncbi:MAG: amidase [Paralcaligenes sp.]
MEYSILAFRDFDRQRLLTSAAEQDRRPEGFRGPLHGLIVAVKEVFDVAHHHCSWGLPALCSRVPTEDAAIVTKLKQLGAVIAGTTISTELAIARAGPTRNPVNCSLTPGGSSSGSAAAVAAAMVPIAVGSQTIGSIVRPAAFCGVVGFKPTRGLLDMGGMMPLAPPLDHIGFFGTNVSDVQFIAHFVSDMPYTQPVLSASSVSRVLLAIPDTQNQLGVAMSVAFKSFTERLAGMPIRVSELKMPVTFSEGLHLAQIIVVYNIARYHSELLERNKASISPQLLSLLERGQQTSDFEYQLALERCEAITRKIEAQADDETIILSPATDGLIPRWREDHTGSPLYQALWTITGMPVISMPIGGTAGLPLSVQLVAPHHCDSNLLAFAKRMELLVRT